MTSLLVLARELLDRATNPAHGVAINEEHSALLASTLGPEDRERFVAEVARLDDARALTSHAWVWVLEFAIGHRVQLSFDLLVELCDRWDEPAIKALAIEAALTLDAGTTNDPSTARDELWLSAVIERATPGLPPDAADDRAKRPVDRNVDTTAAEALVTALLVVGSEQTLEAARRLLTRSWPGRSQLVEFVNGHLEDRDPVAQIPWRRLLDQ